MGVSNPMETARVTHLLERATKAVNTAAQKLNEAQVDSAVGRKEYFEKLAIGAGAAIAAIVSFLGTHAGRLQPIWIMRLALIALVVSLVSALYRNLRYPNYVLQVRQRIWQEAQMQEQQCKKEYFRVQRTIDVNTGKYVDPTRWAKECEASEEGIKGIIAKSIQRENRLQCEWHYAEYICLASVLIAMLSLVCLAWVNF